MKANQRSKSMKDLEINLANKTREANISGRSVSFSGVSVMVDAIMNIYQTVSKDKKSELLKCVANSNITEIR